jgi:hypothetical protein
MGRFVGIGESKQRGAKRRIDRRSEVRAWRSDAGGEAAKSSRLELCEELTVRTIERVLIRKAHRIERKVVVRWIRGRNVLWQAEVRRNRVRNPSDSLIEDRRADYVHTGDVPLRGRGGDLVWRAYVNHRLYSQSCKKALV